MTSLTAELEFVAAAVLRSPAWWQDDRRNWCAYCGIPMRVKGLKGGEIPPSARTRDHIIPLGLNGGLLTIPACRACNAAKGNLSLQAFLLGEYFGQVRRKGHKHQWPVKQLLLASAAAAIRAASRLDRAKSTAAAPLPIATKSKAGVRPPA